MDKRDESGRDARRRFLKSMALTGGGVAVAVKLGQAAAATEPEGQAAVDKATEDYHVTQHIRDYYARAQF